jgi:hypothetical protein
MIQVNVFESLFGQGTYSVPFQTPEKVRYAQRQNHFDGTTIFVDAWIGSDAVSAVRCSKKVGWLREPYCLHPESYEAAWSNRHKFDAILTYDEDFLGLEPYRFCPYGGTWLPKDTWGLKPKTKLCSMLVGQKMAAEGHRKGRETADALKGKLDLFDSARDTSVTYGLDTKLRTLEDYAFTNVVENCYQDNYFDEWLLDAMSQGTIPLLWGCGNIDRFFDKNGIIVWQTIEQLVNIVSSLSLELYQRMFQSAELNLAVIEQYAIPEDWVVTNCPDLFRD